MDGEKKYGNDNFWCFIPEGWSGKEVAIWKGPEGHEEIIARASNKYEAKNIVDALLKNNHADAGGLSTKELAFLEFACAHCDKSAYEDLKNKFPRIYG